MKEVKILIAEYIASLKNKTGITNNADIAEMSNTAEGTVKNLSNAKVDNPGIVCVSQVVYSMGGSLDEMFNQEKDKESISEISMLAMKDIYENQLNSIKGSYDEQVSNIRSHYEQHHEDLKGNYEKRLADKRELIESYKEHLKTKETENKWLKGVCVLLFSVFAALCIVELCNPTLGWIRF